MRTPLWTLYRREVVRSWRVRGQTFGAPLVSAVLYILIFGVSIGSYLEITPGAPYLNFLVPGLVIMAALSNSLDNAASTLVVSKYHGDLQDLRVAPLASHDIIWGISLGGASRGLLIAVGVGIIGEFFSLLFYHDWILVAHPLIALFFLLCAAISFGLLGVTIGLLSRTFDQMAAFSSFLLLPLIYLGGVFFPLDRLPQFWQMLSRFNPMLYYINGLRYGILGEADVAPLPCAFVTLTSLLLAMGLAYWNVRKGRNYCL